MKRLVHETRTPVGLLQGPEAGGDLLVVGGGEGPHGDGQGPDHLQAHVGAPHSLGGGTTEEVGVVAAQDEGPGAAVEGVAGGAGAQVGEGEEAGDVGVVHVVPVSEAVHLVRPDRPVDRMLHHGVGRQGLFHLGGKVQGFMGQAPSAAEAPRQLRQLPQRHHGEVVGGDQEGEDGGVVGGPEDGDDEPHGPDGVSVAGPRHRVRLPSRDPLELVGAPTFPPLLLPEGPEHSLHGGPPLGVEGGGIPGGLPVSVGQADGVAQGIHLPLPLVELRLHLREVVLPRAVPWLLVEGVGVGIYEDASGLTVDDPPDELPEARVLLHEGQVRPHLGRGVPEPHGLDVPGDDEGVGLPVQGAEVHRGVQGVGEAVGEEPGHLRVRHVGGHPPNGLLHRRGDEPALARRRSLGGEVLGPPRTPEEGGGGGKGSRSPATLRRQK